MKDYRRIAAGVGLGLIAFTGSACNSGPQNETSANGAAAANAAGANSASANAAGPSAADNAQRQAEAAALKEAELARGPVALASDSQLPQSCQAYIRATQTCIGRVRASGKFVDNREGMLRRMLHTSRTSTWPAWQKSQFLERGCPGQTEGLATVFPEC